MVINAPVIRRLGPGGGTRQLHHIGSDVVNLNLVKIRYRDSSQMITCDTADMLGLK